MLLAGYSTPTVLFFYTPEEEKIICTRKRVSDPFQKREPPAHAKKMPANKNMKR